MSDPDSQVEGTESELKLDVNVSSTAELERAQQIIASAIQARTDRASSERLQLQLKHIENELALESVVTDESQSLLSLEHLELFEEFLLRTVVTPQDTERHARLLQAVRDKQISHPLAGVSRSGDRAGGHSGYSLLKVPAGRRRQTAAMLYLNLTTGPLLVLLFVVLVLLYVPYGTYLFLLYVTWMIFDNFTMKRPVFKRVRQSWRQSPLFTAFRDYFPIRMARLARLDPSKNYLMCYHPHGVQSAGAFACASSAVGFDALFPGIKASVQTLSVNFAFPITRENIIALGMGDASAECITRALTMGPGHSAVLVTGGAQESMHAHPYNSIVVLKSRAGFVKIALKTGASLVPMWGFGENNLYENLAIGNPRLRSWQRRIQRIISFAPLLIQGRGVFSYSGGLLPHRRPITVVVGAPIDVGPATKEPSTERIEEVHRIYKEQVLELFNNFKDIYDPKAQPIEFI